MSSPGMSLPSGTNPFSNLTDQDIANLAQSMDAIAPGDNLAKIQDVLQQAKANNESYVTAMLQALSADNPKIPPPDLTLDPVQQNLQFQEYLQQHSVDLPGQNSAEQLSYLLNAITAINSGQMSPDSLVLNDTFASKNAADALSQAFGLPAGQSGSAVASSQNAAYEGLSDTDKQLVIGLINNLNTEPVSVDEENQAYDAAYNQAVDDAGGDTTVDGKKDGLKAPGDKAAFAQKSMDDVISLINGFSGTGQVTSDDDALNANVNFAQTLVENEVFLQSNSIPNSDGTADAAGTAGIGQASAADGTNASYLVQDGPLPPLIKGYLNNADVQIGDVSSGIKTLLASIPASGNSPDQIEMKNFLQTVLTALDNLRNLIREIANGNSAKAREASLAKMNDQVHQIKEQIKQQEKAEKAAKKQKTLGLVMKILGPILLVALVVATVASGGLAGPMLALTCAMFAVAIADQVVSQATGKGMFSRMFDAMSQALPPGVALFLKCLTMVAVIAAAVFCPANGAIAMGLAFQIVNSMGIQNDVVSIAKDHGASDKACTIISWSMTGCIAVAGLVATAGRGIQQMRPTQAEDAADALSDVAVRLKPFEETDNLKNISMVNQNIAKAGTDVKTTDVKSWIMNLFKGEGKEAAGRSQDQFSINMQRTSAAISVGSQGSQGAMGIVSGVGAIKRADFDRQNAQIEAMIIELEAQIKALQKIVDSFLNGGSNLNEFADSVTTQINTLFKGMSSQMTALAQAANAKG